MTYFWTCLICYLKKSREEMASGGAICQECNTIHEKKVYIAPG